MDLRNKFKKRTKTEIKIKLTKGGFSDDWHHSPQSGGIGLEI